MGVQSQPDTHRSTLIEVFRFEIDYRLRQPSSLVYAAILLGIPFLMMHAINGSSQLLNAPEMVMTASMILGNLGILVSAAIFGDAAARDVSSRMYSLFYTSPLRESDYIIGRYLGALVVNAVLLLGIPLGLLLASVMPYLDPGKFGPPQIAAYVQAYFLVLLPNLVLIGACMFSAAVFTRRSLATYASGIAVFVVTIVIGDLTNSLSPRLAALADPLGSTSIQSVMRSWVPAERNVRLIGWPQIVLWNRALWIAVASGVIAWTAARFRFKHPVNIARRGWWQRPGVADTAPDRISAIDLQETAFADEGKPRSFTFEARVRQTLEVAVRSWREIAATPASLVILAGTLVFVFAFGWDVGTEVYGTSTWPVTQLVAGTVLSGAVAPIMAMLIAIFAGELVWRERDRGMSDITSVTPVSNAVAIGGRFLALVGMLIVLQAVLAGAGMLLQAVRGYHHYEPLVYLKLLFGVKLVDYVLLAALAMTVHVVVNNKYVGHLLVLTFVVFKTFAGLVGLRHNMLIYGSDPGWIWTDFNGIAPFVSGFVWFKVYWAAWALLLSVITSLFWIRGSEQGLGRRIALARQRLNRSTLRFASAAAVLVVSLSGFVFYNTNVLHVYESPDVQMERQAEYERKYKRFEDVPQPALTSAKLNVEMYPSRQAVELTGTFRFVNRTTRPIDTLHVMLHTEVETRSVVFDRLARAVLDDSVQGYRIYSLERALAPGDSIAMTFDIAQHSRGFRNDGAPTQVTSNGSYIDRTWLPILGYRAGRELSDNDTRRKHGLPPREPPPSAGDVETRATGSSAIELVDVETTVGTDSGQTAITSGTLVKEWRASGRQYFQYRTELPTRFGGAILSADYAVRASEWNGVPLRVLYHPAHVVNVDRMLQSMGASLGYYSQQFGPYQFHELNVVEFPRYQAFARAHPAMIAFSEGSAFLTRVDSGEVDRTFFVVAHETAHQWWGGQVIPLGVPGASMVSETLAQYSAIMVLETVYGREMAQKFVDYHADEYRRGRSVFTNREVPLLDVERQSYVYYFKGGLAMYTLRDRLGADAVNGALRRFREKYAGTSAPPATSRALYAELQSITPDSLRPLLSDLFEHITMWDIRTDSVTAQPDGAGGWRVKLYVDASKARADSVGRQTPIPMNDLVEIGVFGSGSAERLSDVLYLAQHRIQSGKSTIEVRVPRRPAIAGMDPYRKFIERERGTNVKPVQADTLRR